MEDFIFAQSYVECRSKMIRGAQAVTQQYLCDCEVIEQTRVTWPSRGARIEGDFRLRQVSRPPFNHSYKELGIEAFWINTASALEENLRGLGVRFCQCDRLVHQLSRFLSLRL